MFQRTMRRLSTVIVAAGLVGGLVTATPTAWAEPPVDPGVVPAPVDPGPPPPPEPAPVDPMAAPAPAPPGPFDPGGMFGPPAPAAQPIPEGTPEGQNPTPYVGQPVFAPPTFNPTNGSIAGAAKPIYINFARPIADRQLAQDAVHISSVPPVPGRFYWTSDTQLRWRPLNLWPAGTVVNIDAGGTKSSFSVPEQLIATVDDTTKTMTVTRNGVVEKTFLVSLGKPKYETKNGTYYVLEKFADIIMDSSTYGVPVNSAEGYKLKVQDAVRIDNSGIFVHSAPWSVGDQGKRNVSHGCINLAPANAQWFYDNFGSGDAVVVKNSVGTYNQPDGASDWQMF